MTKVSALVFVRESGAIVRVQRGFLTDCLEDSAANFDPALYDFLIGEDADPAKHYVDVDAHAVTAKTAFAISIAGNVVSNVPAGTEVLFLSDRNRMTMDGSEQLELAVDYPETIHLRLSHPHFLDTEIAVECVP